MVVTPELLVAQTKFLLDTWSTCLRCGNRWFFHSPEMPKQNSTDKQHQKNSDIFQSTCHLVFWGIVTICQEFSIFIVLKRYKHLGTTLQIKIFWARENCLLLNHHCTATPCYPLLYIKCYLIHEVPGYGFMDYLPTLRIEN